MSVKFSDVDSKIKMRRHREKINQPQQVSGKFDSIEKTFVTNSYWTKIKKHLIIVVMKLTNEETQKIEQLL
ncbi:hypothetical protein, partial [Streptococcus pseudopneumoniae]|uniref:hypothetical protein n=1 Tax=Streptococcus pseudopneumoniae TaxID=257758 RepID=UPI0019D5EA0D